MTTVLSVVSDSAIPSTVALRFLCPFPPPGTDTGELLPFSSLGIFLVRVRYLTIAGRFLQSEPPGEGLLTTTGTWQNKNKLFNICYFILAYIHSHCFICDRHHVNR